MISITPMTGCRLPDQRKIYRPAAICIAKSNLSLQNVRPVQDPFMTGSAHHARQQGVSNSKRLLSFLLSVTNFYHFPENSLLV
jgi:hypothetical protein